MSCKYADVAFSFQTQRNALVGRVDELQRCCLFERFPKSSAGSMDVAATVLADECCHAADLNKESIALSQFGGQDKVLLLPPKPTQRTCAHEDVKLLCDLESSFREAVRHSKHKLKVAMLGNRCQMDASGVLASPRNPVHPQSSSTHRFGSRSPYQQLTASSKLVLPAARPTGQSPLQAVAAGKGRLTSRREGGGADADLTWQLRKMFSKEVRRKQRKTSVLPQVAEAPMEGLLC